jgi:septal ring factor EnvC (AmiA/AmiB activator)
MDQDDQMNHLFLLVNSLQREVDQKSEVIDFWKDKHSKAMETVASLESSLASAMSQISMLQTDLGALNQEIIDERRLRSGE